MKAPARRRKGFTLLELLMVVIIIAILAAVALPQFLKVTERAQSAQALSYVGMVRSAELRYAAEHGAYVDGTELSKLDISPLPNPPPSWNTPAYSVGVDATDPTNPRPIGFASLQRAAGTYAAQVLGVQYGSGTVCGTFAPYGVVAGCAND